MNNIGDWERGYLALCADVAQNGELQQTRVGDAMAAIGMSLWVRMGVGEFPLLTTRKMYYKPVLGELAAFIRGATWNGGFMDYGCNYWTPNARAWKENNEIISDRDLWLGHIYGYQWRCFGAEGFDQMAASRDMLLKDPNSRRNIITTWDPAELDKMCLPPCHILMQWHAIGGRLDLSVYMRSVDLCLGLPSDVVLYYTLLILMAADVGMRVGDLHFLFGNAHVYKGHAQGLQQQLTRLVGNPPLFSLLPLDYGSKYTDTFQPQNISITEYEPQEPIKYELYA